MQSDRTRTAKPPLRRAHHRRGSTACFPSEQFFLVDESTVLQFELAGVSPCTHSHNTISTPCNSLHAASFSWLHQLFLISLFLIWPIHRLTWRNNGPASRGVLRIDLRSDFQRRRL